MELLKTSWPFDSDPNVTYDDLGYPILDRAVGADTLQRTFDKFFSDGVFSTSDFRISAASGLSVNIQPGMCIINGGMAGWWDEPKVVTLSATKPQWLTHYAIFLRYDNNDDMRGIYLRIDASAAGASVPEPVSAANVTELRIGYVTVPANTTDLSGATFHNEVGTRYAPVTTPLFDIDVTAVLEDLRERADVAYQAYYDLLISAVDGTTAGHLQKQIDANVARIAELEGKEVDPLALRDQMGLGKTGGVLGIPYGGTGVDSKDALIGMVKDGIQPEQILFDVNGVTANKVYYAEGTLEPGYYLFTASMHSTSQTSTQVALSFTLRINGADVISSGNLYISAGYPKYYHALAFLPKETTLDQERTSGGSYCTLSSSQLADCLALEAKAIKLAGF